jgi:hypothetical protein
MTPGDIIDRCGGVAAIAVVLRRHGKHTKLRAIHYWRENGIPPKHFGLISALSGLSVGELFVINDRFKSEKKTLELT